MVIIVFAVTTGFNLFSHFCFMGGSQEISTSEIHSCCSLEPVATSQQLTSKCCDDGVHFIKLDFTTVVAKYQVHQELLPVMAFITEYLSDDVVLNKPDLIYNNLPPPKSGREILTTHQVFRI